MFRRVFPVTGTAFNTSSRWFVSLITPACLLMFPAVTYPEESYLDAISIEAEKLGGAPAGDQVTGSQLAVAVEDDRMITFEQDLEARYKGTYLFYKKLPIRSQEEVFFEHRQGASIEDVRKTIMNRYLHSR